jgi:hypothetical protein
MGVNPRLTLAIHQKEDLIMNCTCARPFRTDKLDSDFEHGNACPVGKLIEDLGFRLVEYNTIDSIKTTMGKEITDEMLERAKQAVHALWFKGERPVDKSQRKHYRGMARLAIKIVTEAERS